MKYYLLTLLTSIAFLIATFTPTQTHANPKPVIDPILVVPHLTQIKPLPALPVPTEQPIAPIEPIVAPTPPPVAPAPVSYAAPTGDDAFYKNFIYMHESGNSPTIYNSSGCLGLGQACPASKLLAVCPDMNYACEDAWFSAYAVRAYGSWAGAYSFWLAHSWW